MSTPLLEARGLGKVFESGSSWLSRFISRRPARRVRAVDDVSFVIERGRTLGLVGESGCGKSTVARLVVGLMAPSSGEVTFGGAPLEKALAQPAGRRRLQMIFQDPYASLDARWTVERIIAEPLVTHRLGADATERRERVGQLLRSVGLAEGDAGRLPHQFSGGQRQRVSIARALASSPDVLVCDEPTSALDVSVQAQVLNLMKDLQRERGLAYLFISHNLAVIRHMSDDVGVMYLGRIVERASRERLFDRPMHPYTRMLLAAVPDPKAPRSGRAPAIGEPPDPASPPTGCAFHPRCPHANARCVAERPMLLPHGDAVVACHAVEEGRA